MANFILKENGATGIIGSYADDALKAGNSQYEILTEKTLSKVESKSEMYENLNFYGHQINNIALGLFELQ